MHLRLTDDEITNEIPCIVWADQRSVLATYPRLYSFLA